MNSITKDSKPKWKRKALRKPRFLGASKTWEVGMWLGCFWPNPYTEVGGTPPKWMVKIMENPMNKWMIWVVFPLFIFENIHSDSLNTEKRWKEFLRRWKVWSWWKFRGKVWRELCIDVAEETFESSTYRGHDEKRQFTESRGLWECSSNLSIFQNLPLCELKELCHKKFA